MYQTQLELSTQEEHALPIALTEYQLLFENSLGYLYGLMVGIYFQMSTFQDIPKDLRQGYTRWN